MKPKSRQSQKYVRSTGDFKPPITKTNKSGFVTLDVKGNKVTYYTQNTSKHPRLPTYLKKEEIFCNEKIKRCTLKSYLHCDESTHNKKVCSDCLWFREKIKRDDFL